MFCFFCFICPMYTFQTNTYTNEIIAPWSSLELVDFLDVAGKKTLTLHEHSSLTYVVIATWADIVLDIHTLWTHATCTIFALFLSRGACTTDCQLTVHLDHSCTAAAVQLVSLLYDGAHADIDGSLRIWSWLYDTQGKLFEHTVVLWEPISFRSLPQLSVASHEVSASHGATVDTLDPIKLFYMMSKGLSQSQAQHLLVEWYLQSALGHIQHFSDEDKHDIMLRLGI